MEPLNPEPKNMLNTWRTLAAITGDLFQCSCIFSKIVEKQKTTTEDKEKVTGVDGAPYFLAQFLRDNAYKVFI